jgi:hypothetical protein
MEAAGPQPRVRILMEKKRLQLDFSESAYRDLEELQNRLNAPSKSEVIRNALGVLRWVVGEVDQDHRILVEKPEGTREIVFHFITRAPANKASGD